jgi:TolA-binding protein
MKKSNFLFLVISLVIVSGLMRAYSSFQNYFSPVTEQAHLISELQRELAVQKIQTASYQREVIDIQQQYALELPALDSLEKNQQNFRLRSIASVVQSPSQMMDLSPVILERAKSQFRNKEYDLAIGSLNELMSKYPGTPLQAEINFFLAESYFMLGRTEQTLGVVEKMMTQYPQNELTGFIMLRMGQILQKQQRHDEAAEVFRVVSRVFAFNQELKKQAQVLESAIE